MTECGSECARYYVKAESDRFSTNPVNLHCIVYLVYKVHLSCKAASSTRTEPLSALSIAAISLESTNSALYK